MEKEIVYFGQKVTVACDGNCNKAWGTSTRPSVQLSENDEDDFEYLADNELGDAPENPGTSEWIHCKPLSVDEFPNKWCVRQCERSYFVADSHPPDFSLRVSNIKK